MLFCFTTRDTRQETNQFFYQFNELESGLEFLNYVVRQGDVLVEVYLLDDGQRTILSVNSFDGLPILAFLRKLEADWTVRLDTSLQLQRQVFQKETRWYRRKLGYYEQRIINLELMIDDTTRCLERVSSLGMRNDQAVTGRYRSLVGRYRVQLGQSRLIRSVLLNRLYDPTFAVETTDGAVLEQ